MTIEEEEEEHFINCAFLDLNWPRLHRLKTEVACVCGKKDFWLDSYSSHVILEDTHFSFLSFNKTYAGLTWAPLFGFIRRDDEKGKRMWNMYLEREDSKVVGERFTLTGCILTLNRGWTLLIWNVIVLFVPVDLFVGQLKSCVTCAVCGFCSTVFDPFWDLSIPVAQVRTRTHTHTSERFICKIVSLTSKSKLLLVCNCHILIVSEHFYTCCLNCCHL